MISQMEVTRRFQPWKGQLWQDFSKKDPDPTDLVIRILAMVESLDLPILCVKVVPYFHPKNGTIQGRNFTYLEDPGLRNQKFIWKHF